MTPLLENIIIKINKIVKDSNENALKIKVENKLGHPVGTKLREQQAAMTVLCVSQMWLPPVCPVLPNEAGHVTRSIITKGDVLWDFFFKTTILGLVRRLSR